MNGVGLPDGWVISPLEKVVDILDTMRVPVNNTERCTRIAGKSDNELYSYYGATGEVGKIDSYIFDEELIALGEDGVPFLDNKKNKAYLLQGKTWVNNHAHVLKAIESLSQTKFILHFLNQFDYQGYVNGGTRLKLTQANMRRVPICIPSFQEQIIIAEKIDTLLAQVDNTKTRLEQIPKILKLFRQAVLATAVIGRLTEANPTESGMKQTVKFEEILKNKKQLSYGVLKPGNYEANGVPMIRVMDIGEWGKFNQTDIYKISDKLSQDYKKTIVKEGDVILSIMATIGRAAIIPSHLSGANVNRALAVIKLSEFVISKYILLQLQSPQFQEAFINKQLGSAQKRINLVDLRRFSIWIPDINSQIEIVRRVEQLFALADTIEKQVNAALEHINHLTQSILAKAFRGDLTAQWRAENPDLISGENSAAALLEKIKAERAAAGGKKTSRKKS